MQRKELPITYWLSYGGGVNSTALAVLLANGNFPKYSNWKIIFSDTGEEKPETYAYIKEHFIPWLDRHGKSLVTVGPKESILDRWERLRVTGSRIIRGCTVEGKIKPIEKYIKENGTGFDVQLIGIDAGEAHRMPNKVRPLVDLDIDRDDCEQIIKKEGLPSPGKSGCWCCPFMRVRDVIKLIKTEPCKFERIERLEILATETHGLCPDGTPRTQWGNKTASEWRKRASQNFLIYDVGEDKEDDDPHCGCYDG